MSEPYLEPSRPPEADATTTERQAIERCRRGDPAGLELLYGLHGRAVYRVARNLLGQDADAEDATQEVFLRAFDKIDSFEERSRFSTWLYRLTVRHCLNRARSAWRRRARALDEEPATPASSTTLDDVDEVDRLLSGLAPEARAILALREIEGLDYREIAGVLDVPIGTVMSRLHRARESLRRKMDVGARPSTRGFSPAPSLSRSDR